MTEPQVANYTRVIQQLEAAGDIDPDCPACMEAYISIRRTGSRPFAPRHKASPRCQCGQRPHCSCSTCW